MQTLHWDSINPFTGQPFTWDDQNLRWGYYLEPGDPGFVPYPAVNQPPQKTKRMKRQTYYPTSTPEQIVWLENFRNKLATYQAALALTAGQVTAAVADARWLIYVLGSFLPAVRAYAVACTNAATAAQSGTDAGAQVLPVFTAPTPPTGVTPAVPGALNRIFALVATMKDLAACTAAIKSDLRLVGPEKQGPDLATIAPVLTLKLVGGRVEVGWGWQGFSAFLDLCEIEADRGTGGWALLTYDSTPDYTDTTPLPATAAKWKYRAIYRVGDARVGVWSAEASIAVGG